MLGIGLLLSFMGTELGTTTTAKQQQIIKLLRQTPKLSTPLSKNTGLLHQSPALMQ